MIPLQLGTLRWPAPVSDFGVTGRFFCCFFFCYGLERGWCSKKLL